MSEFLPLVTLQGPHVQLEPLTRDHVDALREAVADGQLWNLWYAHVPTPEAMPHYVDKALAMRAEGVALPFAVRVKDSDQIVGTTRCYAADPGHRHLSIGYTWYAAHAQHTGINTECKWLLLRHAFETLNCVRVEFCTHRLNHRSRAAIERLGAQQEGVLRNHRILADGSLRDSVVFSIIDAEWPTIKRHLNFKLQRNDKP